MTRSKAQQAAGELFLYVPLIVLSAMAGIGTWVALAMMTFFAGKFAYHKEPDRNLHVKTSMCVAVSYGSFIAVGLITSGITASVRIINNEPMIPILLTVLLTWLWAEAGEWQHTYNAGRDELTRREKPFNPDKCTMQELIEQRAYQTMSTERKLWCLSAFVDRLNNKQLAALWGIEYQSAKNRKATLRKELKST
jgi:hypothetical protein